MPEILRAAVDKQRSIGIFAVAARKAHTVGDDAVQPLDAATTAARTHAEGEDTAAAGQMQRQLIIRRGERLGARSRAVLRGVDQALGMLDAHADGKGLLHQVTPAWPEAIEGIAGAVADGEHHGLAGSSGRPARL